MNLFAEQIAKIMGDRGLNQSELSRILNVRQSQISNWINGKSLPSYNSLCAICDKLGVGVEIFFDKRYCLR